jgi:hypothetical protein
MQLAPITASRRLSTLDANSTPDTMADVHTRLARLERSNRRLRASVGALALAALVLATLGMRRAAPAIVEAQEFRLVGANGQLGGAWRFDSLAPSLHLNDGRGNLRIGLIGGSRGSMLVIRDATSPRLWLRAASDAEARLDFIANDGSQRLSLEQTDTTAMLAVYGPSLKKRATLVAAPTGTAIGLFDERGEVRAGLSADVKVGGGIVLLDAYGRPRN